jgi:hypothetical protein
MLVTVIGPHMADARAWELTVTRMCASRPLKNRRHWRIAASPGIQRLRCIQYEPGDIRIKFAADGPLCNKGYTFSATTAIEHKERQ